MFVILLICGLVVFALTFCVAVIKLRRWLDDIRIVKIEMSRAGDWE